ncbi:MAG: bifunctional precorrin-2 dehydrogenase/sirohydrochlorin ferrochelatase [Bryobacteraceae bacterium]|nr:bifunctional precorrin-2 dehydrogenase/sirohydrochlorin ferrochelatase [Bryobacteraceae bacterium]
MKTQPYPIMLDLGARPCLVIGNGREAAAKVRDLESAGANVTWLQRSWQPGDFRGFFLAIAADDDRSNNAAMYAEAVECNVLFNALDDPPHCQFYFPSVHRQGDLVIAISTNGKCPALAVRIREQLAERYGPEYGRFLVLAGTLREKIAAAFPNFETRKRVWYALVDSLRLERTTRHA